VSIRFACSQGILSRLFNHATGATTTVALSSNGKRIGIAGDTKRRLASSTAAHGDDAPVASSILLLSSANATPTEWRIDEPSSEPISLDSSISPRYLFCMTEAAPINAVMRALADPTRRAVFERIVSSDEITVVELTRGSGVTQGAISQHLKALKQAGLVAERPEGRKVYYRAQQQGLEPLVDWMSHYGVFWRERFANLRTLLKEIDP
jgi:DNA-binding transcriptional ArsR family regulator